MLRCSGKQGRLLKNREGPEPDVIFIADTLSITRQYFHGIAISPSIRSVRIRHVRQAETSLMRAVRRIPILSFQGRRAVCER
jgi:hypothetical protein